MNTTGLDCSSFSICIIAHKILGLLIGAKVREYVRTIKTQALLIFTNFFPYTLQEPHELIIAGQDKIDITIHGRKTTYLCEVVVMRDLS